MRDPEPRLANLRDVGDIVPGIRPGLLWRSDAPHSADDEPSFEGAPENVPSAAWPPSVVIDLRDEAERSEDHPLRSQARVVNLPLLGGRAAMDDDPAEIEEFFNRGIGHVYRSLLDDEPAVLLVRAIDEIARAEGPVLVHCTAGKDRTGVTIALALSLVGVSEADILADYGRTGQNMPSVHRRARLTVSAQTLGAQMALAIPASTFHTIPEAMGAFLDELHARGGAVQWFRDAGGSAATVEALRVRLLA